MFQIEETAGAKAQDSIKNDVLKIQDTGSWREDQGPDHIHAFSTAPFWHLEPNDSLLLGAVLRIAVCLAVSLDSAS